MAAIYNNCMTTERNSKSLLEEIENERESHVLVYVTGDRQPFPAQIGEDVVRPMYDHLISLENSKPKRDKLDLFLYSRGGDVSVPWRMVSMFRQVFGEFSVLIPYKAYSAATMISLGADTIVMGRKAELGPIDPTLTRRDTGNIDSDPLSPKNINVEDVLSYISFVKEQANINDQAALAQLVGMLSSSLSPLTLGSINRQHSHIRLVARKLLTSHGNKIDEERLSAIIEVLTEKIYSHGHAIGRAEAEEIGLPIEKPSTKLENTMWQLFEEYEKELSLGDALDPMRLLGDEEEAEKNLSVGVLESTQKFHRLELQANFIKNRNVPGNPQINLNLNVALPTDINQHQSPLDLRQRVEPIIEKIRHSLPALVRDEILRQSPFVGIGIASAGARWVEK